MDNYTIDMSRAENGVVNLINIEPTATTPRIAHFVMNWQTFCKPDHPGQLFYKDFFNLKPNTELSFCRNEKVHFHGQFVDLFRYTSGSKKWRLHYRSEKGDIHGEILQNWGVVKSKDGKWAAEKWITLKDNND